VSSKVSLYSISLGLGTCWSLLSIPCCTLSSSNVLDIVADMGSEISLNSVCLRLSTLRSFLSIPSILVVLCDVDNRILSVSI